MRFIAPHRSARGGNPRRARAAVALLLAVMMPLGLAATLGKGKAAAAFNPAGIDVWATDANGVALKTRVFRAADGNTNRVVYALDGLRARTDLSGWEIDTDVPAVMARWNINVVMPVGGENSFYSDWIAPSTFFGGSSTGSANASGPSGSTSGSGQRLPYRLETFITNQLPAALAGRFGFSRHGNGVMGLSMGGSAALMFAAYYPQQFRYAASFSGYLNVSAPGMKEAMRLAMLSQNGYNIDCMWGPPWDLRWLRNDPFVFAPLLKANNTRLFIAAGSGIPGYLDQPHNLLDVYNTANAMGLEAVALANTRAFQLRMQSLGYNNVIYDFPPVGTHSWPWWSEDVFRMLPDMSAHIG